MSMPLRGFRGRKEGLQLVERSVYRSTSGAVAHMNGDQIRAAKKLTPRFPTGVFGMGGTRTFPGIMTLLSFMVGPFGARSTSKRCIYHISRLINMRSAIRQRQYFSVYAGDNAFVRYEKIGVVTPITITRFWGLGRLVNPNI